MPVDLIADSYKIIIDIGITFIGVIFMKTRYLLSLLALTTIVTWQHIEGVFCHASVWSRKLNDGSLQYIYVLSDVHARLIEAGIQDGSIKLSKVVPFLDQLLQQSKDFKHIFELLNPAEIELIIEGPVIDALNLTHDQKLKTIVSRLFDPNAPWNKKNIPHATRDSMHKLSYHGLEMLRRLENIAAERKIKINNIEFRLACIDTSEEDLSSKKEIESMKNAVDQYIASSMSMPSETDAVKLFDYRALNAILNSNKRHVFVAMGGGHVERLNILLSLSGSFDLKHYQKNDSYDDLMEEITQHQNPNLEESILAIKTLDIFSFFSHCWNLLGFPLNLTGRARLPQILPPISETKIGTSLARLQLMS